MDMLDFVMGIGFAFVLEGLLWSLFPTQIVQVIKELSARNPQNLRLIGAASMALGIALIWFVKTSRLGG